MNIEEKTALKRAIIAQKFAYTVSTKTALVRIFSPYIDCEMTETINGFYYSITAKNGAKKSQFIGRIKSENELTALVDFCEVLGGLQDVK